MNLLSGFANRLRVLQGEKAYGAAFMLGVCFTAAFPPFWALPLGALGISGWLWLLQGAPSARKAFIISWWFGFGHHTTGLYWICIALGVDGGAFIWLMPFALCLLPAYLSLFIGAAAAVCHRFRRKPAEQVVWFALMWLLAEYIRAHLLYGFPWNLAGYIWTLSDATLQIASVVGVYGMSLWALIFCGAFSLLAVQRDSERKPAYAGFTAVMLCSLVLAGWGQWRLAQSEAMIAEPTGIQLRLVQASVEQSLKWDPQFQRVALERHINLSKRPTADGHVPNLIIWPETAMPFSMEEGSKWAQMLGEVAPVNGALITGTVRSDGRDENWRVWNSLRAVDSEGHIISSYDKTLLVPFGEFIPLRDALSFLPIAKVTKGATDFSKGNGAEVMGLAEEVPLFQPLICYETIFPDYRPADGAPQAAWLLNITNDAWFGTSTGPYQHLHMSQTRAVERGAPMVRVANTGVSAVYDAFGRLKGQIPLNEQGVLDVELPAHIVVPTWYSLYGEFTLIIICYILLICALRTKSKSA